MEQLDATLYPIQSVESATMLYRGTYGMPGPYSPHEPNRLDPYYVASYFRGRDWLDSPPVGPADAVFLARAPEVTLVVSWREFVEFWDAFYSHTFTSVHVCDDSNEWFLMLNMERLMIFGCTRHHALRFDLSSLRQASQPIEYGYEFRQARMGFDEFATRLRASG